MRLSSWVHMLSARNGAQLCKTDRKIGKLQCDGGYQRRNICHEIA
jgi:hypothetical protein